MQYRKARIEALQQRMRERRLDVAFVSPSADMEYLIGGRLPLTERLNQLVIPAEGDCSLVVPKLQLPLVAELRGDIDIQIWDEDISPLDLVARLAPKGAQRAAVDGHMWATFVLGLQERLPGASFTDVSPLLSAARICKEDGEIDILQEAAQRFDAIWTTFFERGRLLGRSEYQIANDIRDLILEHGFDSVLWCDVGGGPNGASPLHHGSQRVVEPGDPVVIDFAASYKGYVMDTCRTPVAGEADPEFVAIYDIVNKAYEAGLEAVQLGSKAESVDHAARKIIEDAGFGANFLHRLGHGLGLDAHEEPYIVKGNEQLLRPGMVFSNEPGIYVPGKWGVRIENIIVVTEDGGRSLSQLTRELVSMH